MKIRLTPTDGRPLTGVISIVRRNFGLNQAQPIPADGIFDLTTVDMDSVKQFLVCPDSGHATIQIDYPFSSDQIVNVPPLSPQCFSWWREALGVESSTKKGEGIRIGIIDQGFAYDDSLCSIELLGKNNVHLTAEEVALWPRKFTHAADIARLIIAQGEEPHARGLAPNATLKMRLVKGKKPTINKDEAWAALHDLIGRDQVDIISMSYGESPEYLRSIACDPDLEERIWAGAVQFAESRGVTLIASAGNDADHSVTIPARCAGVIGVAGVGCSGLGLPPVYSGLAEEHARNAGEVTTSFAPYEIFSHVFTASGPGVDCCAPSVGFAMKQHDGKIIEFAGTSFSAPAVAAALACKLSDDADFKGKSGHERSAHALGVWKRMCRDLKINPHRQGKGFVTVTVAT